MSIWSTLAKVGSVVAPIAGSFFGPAGTVLGAGLGAGLGKISDNHDAAQSRQFQIDQVNAQNQYNSPVEQSKRYLAAGLNPNFMFGSGTGSAGTQTVVPSDSNAVSIRNAGVGKDNEMMQMMSTLLNVTVNRDLLKAQTDKTLADAKLAESQKDLVPSQIGLNYANAGAADAHTNALNLQADAQSLENRLTKFYGDDRIISEIKNVNSQTVMNTASLKKIAADVNLVAQQSLTEVAKRRNLNAESAQIQSLLPWVVADLKAKIANSVSDNQFKLDELQFQHGNSGSDFPTNFGNRARMAGFNAQNLQNRNAGLQNEYDIKRNAWQNIQNALGVVGDVVGLGFIGKSAGDFLGKSSGSSSGSSSSSKSDIMPPIAPPLPKSHEPTGYQKFVQDQKDEKRRKYSH